MCQQFINDFSSSEEVMLKKKVFFFDFIYFLDGDAL
jgi:hypothetical protein